MPMVRAPQRDRRRGDLADDGLDGDVVVEWLPRRRTSSTLHRVPWMLAGAVAAALPWAWFAVRDRSVIFEVVAIMLPLVGLAVGYAAVVVGMVVAAWHERWRWRWGDRWPQRWRQLRRVLAVMVVMTLSTVAMVVTAVRLPWTAQALPAPSPDAGVHLVVANVLKDNPVQDAAAAKVLALDADVVVTAETTGQVDEALESAYPYVEGGYRPWREDTPNRPGNDVEHGVGVYARLPLTVLPDPPGLEVVDYRVARVRVDAPAGPFVLYALHLPKPGLRTVEESRVDPYHYARLVAALRRSVAAEELPVVVAGDLNATDRGRGYRQLTGEQDGAALRDAIRVVPAGPTSVRALWRLLFLRIDHVLLSDGMCAADADRVAVPGSDHRGLVVRVGACGADGDGGSVGSDDRA